MYRIPLIHEVALVRARDHFYYIGRAMGEPEVEAYREEAKQNLKLDDEGLTAAIEEALHYAPEELDELWDRLYNRYYDDYLDGWAKVLSAKPELSSFEKILYASVSAERRSRDRVSDGPSEPLLE